MDTVNTIEYYNKNAEKYTETTLHADVSALYEHFVSKIKKPASILDLGCGSGRDSKYFLDAGYRVTAIDGSRELCQIASELIQQPVRQLLFEDLDYHEEFDAVWACASLLHVPKSEIHDIMRKVCEALKPDGILYFSVKYGTEERTVGERSFSDYTEADIPWLLKDTGLEIVEHWISQDVRQGRNSEKWLNLISHKQFAIK